MTKRILRVPAILAGAFVLAGLTAIPSQSAEVRPGPGGGIHGPMGGMHGPMGGMHGPTGGMSGPTGGMTFNRPAVASHAGTAWGGGNAFGAVRS